MENYEEHIPESERAYVDVLLNRFDRIEYRAREALIVNGGLNKKDLSLLDILKKH